MSSGPLRKGQACVCCRRRKTRCDGLRPVCGQCTANGRDLDCEYSDGFNPTRTEMLQEYLENLKIRVQELETEKARHAKKKARSRPTNMLQLNVQPSSQWWATETPSPQISRSLLNILRQHETQIGWALSTERFTAALSAPFGSASYPHPALVNAAFLWGLRLSRSPAATPDAENAFFTRASAYLQTQQPGTLSLRHGLHAVQAEVLLSTYLFATGAGALETEYHVNAALSLAIGFGMNLISTSAGAADAVEDCERINVFWKVFYLDRMWALANRKPAALAVEGGSSVVITTPWPADLHEYVEGNTRFSGSGRVQSLMNFLAERGKSNLTDSNATLFVKAAFVCERSTRFAALSPFDDEIRQADSFNFAFLSSLPVVDSGSASQSKISIISIHAMAYLSLIRLHEQNALRDSGASLRCVQAARYIAALLGNFTAEGEIGYIDPFAMPCFTLAAKVIMREILRVRQGIPSQNASSATLTAELDGMLLCLSQLEPLYPVIAAQLESLTDMRNSMQI